MKIEFDERKHINPLDEIMMEQNPYGDPDFDPEHNARVMKESIERNNRLRARKQRDFEDGVRERSSATAMYLKSLEQGGRKQNIKEYFGDSNLAYLKGQNLMEKLRDKKRRGGRVITRVRDAN